ncbi:MAG TPA: hypothetical protein VGM83_14070 [Devosiaceae bacterium]|jgi:hypothetical protein
MDGTFLALVAAYLFAEFPLQSLGDDRPFAFWPFVLHLVVVGVVTTAILGGWQPAIIAGVLVAHLVTEPLRRSPTLSRFALAQAVHLAVLGGLAVLFPTAFAQGWAGWLTPVQLGYGLAGLTLAAGLILGVEVGGVVVGLGTKGLRAQIDDDMIDGLRGGSLYIGWLERALVMLLVLINQPAGVGFVITAKSILRFSDAKDIKHRQASEYIIIGTFMSFGWGLAVALLTHWTIGHWLPETAPLP